MSDIQLKEMGNWGRFSRSLHHCPQCDKVALCDNWPPNYGGASGSISLSGGDFFSSESGATIKHVCKSCRIAFVISTYEKTTSGQVVETRADAHNIVPLVEQDGFWLTPHDVWREEYKQKHGEYPAESYG